MDDSGSVDYDEFIETVRGPMNARRRSLVRRAFDVLDRDKSGAIEPSEVVGKFDASRHPEVLKGAKTPDEVLREFLDTFDVGGVIDGKVTFEEFQNYYRNVSASIDRDDYFELMLRNAWHLAGGEGWCANSSNLRCLCTHANGSQSVQRLDDDLGLELPKDAGEVLRRLRVQGLTDVVRVEGASGGSANAAAPKSLATAKANAETRERARATKASDLRVAAAGASPRRKAPSPPPPVPSAAPPGTQAVVEALRRHLKDAFGSHGLHALRRSFRRADASGDGVLSLGEFTGALRGAKFRCSGTDAEVLFRHFDRNGSGVLDWGEFAVAARGTVSDRRRAAIRAAFQRVDEGHGAVSPKSLAAAYDAAAHPDVLEGRATADEVYARFVENFEASSPDAATLGDFEAYRRPERRSASIRSLGRRSRRFERPRRAPSKYLQKSRRGHEIASASYRAADHRLSMIFVV